MLGEWSSNLMDTGRDGGLIVSTRGAEKIPCADAPQVPS